MRVGVLAPDRGANGGYERLLNRLTASLRDRGVALERVTFDSRTFADRPYGVPVDQSLREQHPEYFLYMSALERMDWLRLDAFDVLLATHAPTYLAQHPRRVVLFYHQNRVFYDLSDEYVSAGFVRATVHDAARSVVHRIDTGRLGGVHSWVAGSVEAASRLGQFWGISAAVSQLRAAPETSARPRRPYDPTGPALCVSRHEWPKRTELIVQASSVSAGRPAPVAYELVGGGSRLDWLVALAARYRDDPDAAVTDGAAETWCNIGPRQLTAPAPPVPEGNLALLGALDDEGRDDAYDRCGVVICPAYREDYGLTALEGFSRGRPVIVCDDGGGLVELVADTGAGLVVAPDPEAIDDAVRMLRDDPRRAEQMSQAAIEAAAGYRHDDAVDVLLAALEDAADS